MLSILCSTLWGQAGGFSVGVFVGGMMMSGKHKYKREDVKPDKLKAWYLSYLKNKKYPLIEDAARDARKVLDSIDSKLNAAKTIDDIKVVADFLKDDLANMVITEAGLRYFKDDRFKISRIPVSSSDDLGTTRAKYDKVYDLAIGTLGPQDSGTLIYGNPTTTIGVFEQAQNTIERTRDESLREINNYAKRSATDFLLAVKDGSVDAALVSTFETAAANYRAGVLAGGGALLQSDPLTQALTGAGGALVKAWVNGKIRDNFIRIINQKIAVVSEELDDPLQNALKAYQADQEVEPTADQYDPNNENKALTSPELGKEPGEQGKWETLEGEVKSKRIGLTYGFSVGYEKEMNKNHAFVGGNAFAKKDSLTIKYDLQVEKGNRASFGELEAKPGYTFGVTVVAGKHLNPVFSVFGRGTFEFTKWGFNYDTKKDSPSMENDRIATQKLGNWVKQAAVGVGARYNFAPLWSAEVCYDFIPATKTTVRDFNKLADDGRRRGYIYTSSQHRAFLKVVRFFNM